MLNEEEASRRLEAFTGYDVRAVRVLRLSVSGSLTRDVDAWLVDRRTHDPVVLARKLDELTPAKRARVFAALCPALGDAIARWWTWAQRRPYQEGWMRRGFRSTEPADSRAARMHALAELIVLGRTWPQKPGWFAIWSFYLRSRTAHLGDLLASEISHGNLQVAEILADCALGRHEIGVISTPGIAALLGSDRPECWSTVTTLLEGAGRQEGLRSVILEAADVADPAAFAQVLGALIEHRLTRFSATVRAAGVWFGEELDVRKEKQLAEMLGILSDALEHPDGSVLRGSEADPVRVFVGLWAIAFVDARRAIELARPFLSHDEPDIRRATARLLTELDLPAARQALIPALADPSVAVYAAAVTAWEFNPYSVHTAERLDAAAQASLIERAQTLGKATEVRIGVLGQRTARVGSAHAADVVIAYAGSSPVPDEVIAAASANGRWIAVRRLADKPDANRAALFPFLTDLSSQVRSAAFDALQTIPDVTQDEAVMLEDALRRKASDQRRMAITLLLRQRPSAIRASIDRLASGTAEQVRAAVEIASSAGIANPENEAPTEPLAPAIPDLLRYRTEERTPSVRPARVRADRFTQFHPGCRRVVLSLRAWLSEHADTEVSSYAGVELLSNIRWLGQKGDDGRLPLAEVLEPWWERTEPTLTDGGIELFLLDLVAAPSANTWARDAARRIVGDVPKNPKAPPLVEQIIGHLAGRSFRRTWTDVLLDAAESLASDIPIKELSGVPEVMAKRGRRIKVDQWGNMDRRDARSTLSTLNWTLPDTLLHRADLTTDQLARLWRLARFIDEPEGAYDVFDGPRVRALPPRTYGSTDDIPETVPDQPHRFRPAAELVTKAYTAGLATPADVIDMLLSINEVTRWAGYIGRVNREGLYRLTPRHLPDWAAESKVQDLVSSVRDALIDTEVRRGDLPTLVSQSARALRSAYGVGSLGRVLAALGKRPFTRGYSWTSSRESALSHLVRIHFPGPGETAADLGEALAAAKVSDKKVVELGVYAPQWAGLIEEHLGWPGFETAVWWLHAHTKDDSWDVDSEIRDEWASAVSQRTPLDAVDLVRGAADVDWFRSFVAELGRERFATVLAAAKYASSSGGHKRAELFAQALLGKVDESALLARMDQKRHQDSVRALGLLPLSGPDDPAVLSRYETLRGFVASDRTSGSQRRASETTAVEVGLENLARSAGYRDPQRLIWAMEAHAVRDLADGPVTAHDGDLAVTLSITPVGKPEILVARDGKPLKSVPTKSAKVPEIAELKGRLTTLRKQLSRMRKSLENACVTGERFDDFELADLLGHPLLAPMLRDLVLVSEEGFIGFAGVEAQSLVGPAGEPRQSDGSPLRIAHPVDLLASGEWADFQHALFEQRRTQPFRQLFRELYVPVGSELEPGATSRRYSGHQVEARRAGGIFTSRGWVADFETGFSRTFHHEKLVAWCGVLRGWGTAAEVEDATIEDVRFTRVGSWDPISPADIPPRLFSETMRDLDLVASVAHSGGVDPETTESSIEMRGRLVEETADLLSLTNVEVSGHHARVKGTLGTYSVQLGSGVVHRIPGNAVCIIPVSAQHRGRIFLPFADDDPRTAEVISKVVLLARDDKIQDPTILEQLV